jgi:hypothetical protein
MTTESIDPNMELVNILHNVMSSMECTSWGPNNIFEASWQFFFWNQTMTFSVARIETQPN